MCLSRAELFHQRSPSLPPLVRTDQLLTATPGGFHQPVLLTARLGQRHSVGAQGDARHSCVHTGALVSAVWSKALPVLVDPVVVLAGSSF